MHAESSRRRVAFAASKVVPAMQRWCCCNTVYLSSSTCWSRPAVPSPAYVLGRTQWLRGDGQSGMRVPRIQSPTTATPARSGKTTTALAIDPWSVSPATLDIFAAQFFAASLFPYLGFLYFVAKKENDTPPLAVLGFRFLLVFVFATIPAGIYSKSHYHDILANVDWLHGSAESLLTITNVLIALGFRTNSDVVTEQGSETEENVDDELRYRSSAVGAAALISALLGSAYMVSLHVEPANALSLPTWIIHVASVVDWLVAMGLVWEYADRSGNPRWKGLTWAMVPLHTSGLCACTFHLFYNDPSLNFLVVLQAALTFFGNITLAFAAYRVYEYARSNTLAAEGVVAQAPVSVGSPGLEDLGNTLRGDSSAAFITKLFVGSAIAAAVVKWGSLFVDSIFDPTPSVALAVIFIPTALNVRKWLARS